MDGFEDYYGQTLLHPVAIAAVILLAFAAFVLPRRFAIYPILMAATALPMSQRLVIGGADFTLLRLLLLAYFVRVVIRGEAKDFCWNRLDTLVVLWCVSGTIVMTIHFGTVGALTNRLGWAYDILLTYFVARCLLSSTQDWLALGKFASLLSVPVAAVFLFEWTTRYNLFSVFGGVPFETTMRAGRLRCQGPFSHPIMAGIFWAAMLPLIWMPLKAEGARRLLPYIGTVAALAIVMTTASSTPVVSALLGFIGLALFRYRLYRRRMWAGALALAAVLHFLLMDMPVWHLMARVDLAGGSTGWHRYVILDTFLNNFSDWYLTGEHQPTKWRWQMRDITNQYILEGLRGGLITLSVFVVMVCVAFGNIGKSLELGEQGSGAGGILLWLAWLLGVSLFIHAITFFGVSYFGQMTAILYIQLAMAGTVGTWKVMGSENKKAFA